MNFAFLKQVVVPMPTLSQDHFQVGQEQQECVVQLTAQQMESFQEDIPL